MILEIHATAINTLASSYRALPWYKKLFFPRKIASALAGLPASSNDYTAENTREFVLTYLNTSSFFLNAFKCLKQFLSTPLIAMVMTRNQNGFIEQSDFTDIVTPHKAAYRKAVLQGDVGQLRALCTTLPSAVIQEMLCDNNYDLFRVAAFGGHRDVLEYLQSFVSPDQLSRIFVANFDVIFDKVAENGHLPVLQYLVALAPDRVQQIISPNNETSRYAAINGHLQVIQYLDTLAPAGSKLANLPIDFYYELFSIATENGHLILLEYLLQEGPHTFGAMSQDYYFELFSKAVGNGHVNVLEYLKAIKPDAFQSWSQTHLLPNAYIKAITNGHLQILQHFQETDGVTFRLFFENHFLSNYELFCNAAAKGHLEVLRYLKGVAPEAFQTMILYNHYEAFHQAAANGHINVLRYLKETAPEAFQAMISHNHYEAFRNAASNGHLELLRYLEEQAPEAFERMVSSNDYESFHQAALNGHINVLRYLEEKVPHRLQKMIASNDYGAFYNAAVNGHLAVVAYLDTKAPQNLKKMITMRNVGVFRETAWNGHLKILEYLATKAPYTLSKMIEPKNGYVDAFTFAAERGHLHVLEYLESKAPGGLHRNVIYRNVISSTPNRAILGILRTGSDHPIVERVLEYPEVYAYAEMHPHEYNGVVSKYTSRLLARLQEQKAAFELSNPTGVFDVDVDKAKQLFYVARHFIRLNTPEAHDELVSLLRIPALRALTHQNLRYTTQNNELLQLALSLNNQQAAQSLLAIPEVRALAEQNNFYRNQARGDLDLRALAENRESSMTALTQGERQRLQGVTSRYQPLVQSTGVEALMQTLREVLQSRYAANPASITVKRSGHTQQIQLPLNWEEFNALGLNASEKKAALKTYYTHNDHTALRYLSKPNRWMHERASYVSVNPRNHQEKWSTFDEYMELIGMLYLAAKDEGIAPIDGYTLQTRIEQFIAELAFIGRAHNWDKSRPVRDAQGRSVLQEYDDLEGDRPSCYSGTLRRLFQSVLGHPLLRILTPEILDQEINSFVRDRFTTKFERISVDAHLLIKSAWDKMIALEDLNEEEQDALRALNIAPAEQETLIQDLTQRWGEQFSRDASYTRKITQAFLLADDEYHLSKFDYVHPETLFRVTPPASEAAALTGCSVGTSRDAFFAGTPAVAAVESQSLLTPGL